MTRIRRLSTIEGVGAEEGTKVNRLKQATADNLTVETFTVPPSDCCVTEFRPIRHKLKAPFRLTLKGRIADVQGLEASQAGNEKRRFDIVDNCGSFISCCAMRHSARSTALQNSQEVIIYNGTGRSAIGSSKSALYLMKDAFIVPIGIPTSPPVIKQRGIDHRLSRARSVGQTQIPPPSS